MKKKPKGPVIKTKFSHCLTKQRLKQSSFRLDVLSERLLLRTVSRRLKAYSGRAHISLN